jgi:hypothetical protein
MTDYEFDEKDKMLILKLIGIGIVLVIGTGISYSYLENIEYPDLNKVDSITNQWINTVKTNRGRCYVELQNGLKFSVWGQNQNYEDYTSMTEIISSKVLVSKKTNSDTVIIRYMDRDYKYVIGQVIKKHK